MKSQAKTTRRHRTYLNDRKVYIQTLSTKYSRSFLYSMSKSCVYRKYQSCSTHYYYSFTQLESPCCRFEIFPVEAGIFVGLKLELR